LTSGADVVRAAFESAGSEGRTAIVPFLTVGHPTLETSLDCVVAVVEAGTDVVELGVPFSDPLAEGPVIQASSFKALENGISVSDCIAAAAELRRRGVTVPMVFMGYYNPILSYGSEKFCKDASEAGMNGLIVPDLPTEEAGPLLENSRKHNLSLIPLVALTSPEARVKAAAESASGFVYCVSTLGVTGARKEISGRVRGLVEMVKRHTDLPTGVGFGVSTSEHVAEIGKFADGAVVGSALIRAIDDGPVDSAPERAAEFIRKLSGGSVRKKETAS
jgi:tryptophan synthase alpha chain